MSEKKQTVVFAEVLYDGRKKLENCSIIIEGDKIVEVLQKKIDAALKIWMPVMN